ncbi:MAG: transposase [Planctomycetes bacterium]|nr:transposase [Planctomycetota bacterium]
MGRALRSAPGGFAYHVLNRSNGRLPIFKKAGDFEAFEHILAEAIEHCPMRILAYCLMPNHWHLVLWPPRDGALSDFMHWVTLTHTQRWHAHYRDVGTGHLYQGRFKSFPVEQDEHLLTLLRYVERNPLRANLAARADEWRWGSLWRRRHGDAAARKLLVAWPIAEPEHWLREVQRPQTEAELEALRRCVERGQPFGSENWMKKTSARLGLESSFRSRGRPRKAEKGS